ncbi:hypothetical protein KPL78_26210 [Roseomonas sp. HJA6]|uniref:Cupin domain-containing protein n=1 Tax=Roseomonas alba TaxID=2846776 RepID=A0ABS7AJS7_9PROT|nr:hypothetical protein [Neoroseomonas alba]MBW6401374.1 hypothetical protein [Neoroseomonas alba]
MADERRAHWPKDLQDEIEARAWNGCVGTKLLSETARVRVWHLHIPPGVRFPFHRHVLNYFWTALADGRARNFFEDGRVADSEIQRGLTRHFEFGPGEYLLHSVQNIGTTTLDYTTVEFLGSPNAPLPLPPDHSN